MHGNNTNAQLLAFIKNVIALWLLSHALFRLYFAMKPSHLLDKQDWFCHFTGEFCRFHSLQEYTRNVAIIMDNSGNYKKIPYMFFLQNDIFIIPIFIWLSMNHKSNTYRMEWTSENNTRSYYLTGATSSPLLSDISLSSELPPYASNNFVPLHCSNSNTSLFSVTYKLRQIGN